HLPFPDARVDGPHLAVNAAGDAVITWDVHTPEPCAEPTCTHTLMASLRPHHADSCTAPVALAESPFGLYAPIALDADGNATAAFLEYPPDYIQGGLPRVRVVSMRDGTWRTPITL